MKFLCVPCDTPMQLQATAPPDRGSVALTYGCPDCGYEFAMLTNPHETEVVSSLGVRIGREEQPAMAAGESKCPFTGIVREAGIEPAAVSEVPWTEEARERLDTVPQFVRPMAKTGIEKYAKDKGYDRIDAAVLDEAKQFFGM